MKKRLLLLTLVSLLLVSCASWTVVNKYTDEGTLVYDHQGQAIGVVARYYLRLCKDDSDDDCRKYEVSAADFYACEVGMAAKMRTQIKLKGDGITGIECKEP